MAVELDMWVVYPRYNNICQALSPVASKHDTLCRSMCNSVYLIYFEYSQRNFMKKRSLLNISLNSTAASVFRYEFSDCFVGS